MLFRSVVKQPANTTFEPANFFAHVVAPATGIIEFFLKRLDAVTQLLQPLFIPAASVSAIDWIEKSDEKYAQE